MFKYFVTMAVLTTFHGLAITVGRKPPRFDEDGTAVMTVGWPFRVVGFVLLAIGIFAPLAVLAFMNRPAITADALKCAGLFGAFFAGAGAIVLLETTKSRVIVSDEGIACRSAWSKGRSVRWNEIDEITCSNIGPIIRGPGKQKIFASFYLKGSRFLVRLIQEKVPIDRYRSAAKLFNEITGYEPVEICHPGAAGAAASVDQGVSGTLDGDRNQPPARALRPVRLCIFGLAAFLFLGLMVAAALRGRGWITPPTEMLDLLRWCVIFLAPAAFALSRVWSCVVVKNAREEMVAHDHLQHGRSAESELPGSFAQMLDVYCSQALASLAVLTVAGLCCIAAFLLVGSRSGMVMTFIFILAILALYPNSRRVGKWIERQLQLVDQERAAFRHHHAARAQ